MCYRSRQTYQESLQPTSSEAAAPPTQVECETVSKEKTAAEDAPVATEATVPLGLAATTLVGMEDEDDDYDDV